MSDPIESIIAKMTLEEKAALCTGASPGRPPRSNIWVFQRSPFRMTAWCATCGRCERFLWLAVYRYLFSYGILCCSNLGCGSGP
jgi:hypothetical protein